MTKKSLISRDVERIIKKSFKRIVITSIFLSFLFYLLNIFLGFGIKIEKLWESITSKVGIYFYINDQDKTSDEVFKRILSIKEELDKNGIKSEFYQRMMHLII